MDHKKMKLEDYLQFLNEDIHSTVFSTVDEDGKPKSRVIDIMLVKEKKLYFLTATTKPFYDQLIERPYVSITGLKGEESMSSISITVNGEVREIGTNYLDEIFEKNPYMNDIYQTEESKHVLRVFELYKGNVSVFDLSSKPIYQAVFDINE
ncbi:pyridoxamine 5'-phosphate oxidase family protein [Enterococcus raffinosus]|uniref:pyridoxamine 5'-phosphate oxidase family protein n=1 Tax=Enterococcus raffinosus TaxID=71452 RepID=UPI001C10898C|nr:pyridoxamine 5'-phosphate oxidase family protein [Enterococcus raffinosus]MBU5362587.1 pyridoxamine 5'-phosphate oxidase family protein [Enterococcus raffinosus]